MSDHFEAFKNAMENARQADSPEERARWARQAHALFEEHQADFPPQQRARAQEMLDRLQARRAAKRAGAAPAAASGDADAIHAALKAAIERFEAADDSDRPAATTALQAVFEQAHANKAAFTPDQWRKIQNRYERFKARLSL